MYVFVDAIVLTALFSMTFHVIRLPGRAFICLFAICCFSFNYVFLLRFHICSKHYLLLSFILFHEGEVASRRVASRRMAAPPTRPASGGARSGRSPRTSTSTSERRCPLEAAGAPLRPGYRVSWPLREFGFFLDGRGCAERGPARAAACYEMCDA